MLHPTPITPRRIAALHELRAEHAQLRDEALADALEAERERGAEIAVAELITAARRCADAVAAEPEATRVRIFIARFCGLIQPSFLDLAQEIATAAGMPHLYPTDES